MASVATYVRAVLSQSNGSSRSNTRRLAGASDDGKLASEVLILGHVAS
jgi:hypothetical protein